MRPTLILLLSVLLFSRTSAAFNGDTTSVSNTLRVITLEECIERALEANYSVVISGNSLEIARNNVTLAPFLPSVTLNSRQSASRLNQLNYTSEGVAEKGVVKSASLSNSATVSWRLFDGFYMFASREKQEELLAKGEFNFRAVVENLIMRISTQYYQIISLQNQVNLLNELVSISQIRYNQALTRYNIGSDSGLEYKQARIYLNSDSSRLMLQRENLKNAYIQLFTMMNIDLDSKLIVNDTIIPQPLLDLNQLLLSAAENNTTLNALRAGERVAELDVKIALSARYPTLDFTAGYNYNFNKSQFFPSRYNETDGPNMGFSLSIPLFSGNEINRRVNNSKIELDNARLSLDKAQLELESELRQLYNLYNNNHLLINFEEQSRESAYMNLDAAMEKYRLGSLSGIEFRDYQLSYLDASNRKMNALYQTKISEIVLWMIAGKLF